MKVSSVLPLCTCIAIAICPVKLARAQHHTKLATNNNHRQSNIDTTDIYSRSSGKTTADAIDTTLTFVDDATDGEDGQRNLIEVSSNEDVAEDDEEDDSVSPNAAPKIEWKISSPTPPTPDTAGSTPFFSQANAKNENVETDEGYHIFRNEHFDYVPPTTSSSITGTKESSGTNAKSEKSGKSTDAKTGKAKTGKSDPPPPEPALCNGQCGKFTTETGELTFTNPTNGICNDDEMCVKSVSGNGLTSIDGLCERLEEITDQCVPSSRPSTSPSLHPSNVPSGMPSKEPSSDPSLSPSSIPSNSPSFKPSTQPSLQPSYHPSISGLPSGLPSRVPSNMPSLSPSQQPSNEPSESPSNKPSLSPSQQPSNEPSNEPSESPTREPIITPCTPSIPCSCTDNCGTCSL